ncbi:MAG: osmoprotectant transport system permease protein [Actinomycetota bacterium]|jgi:osmoprotectant transport system permease protein
MSMWNEFTTYVTTASNWHGDRGILHRSLEHLRLSGTAVLVAALIALPIAIWLGHTRRGGLAAQSIVNIGRAVPSLAILALLFPLSLQYGFGLGFWPTLAALVILAVPPMFTNAYTAIRSVDPAIVDSSLGMGMRGLEVVTRVEVPSGLSLILTGVRIATLQVIATATLGAYVGFNGLGSFINEGFRQQDDGKLLTGAIAVALTALLVDVAFGVVVRRATPWRVPELQVSTKGPQP